MFRTIAWYTNFAVSLLFTLPKLKRADSLEKRGMLVEREELIHKTTTEWAMSQVRVSGARVKLHGMENIPKDRNVLFVSNHQSNFDTALFMSFVDKPKGYVAKLEMKKVPILRTWMEYMNCVFIDRGNVRKSAEAMSKAIKILKGGHSLVIFPEGTRSKCDSMGEFKSGGIKLAIKAGVPIVPVTISGSYKLMEQNKNRIKPADVEMHIHPLIETQGLTKNDTEALTEKLKGIIEGPLKGLQ